MYTRLFQPPHEHSFFLFGPRGTGKSHWVKGHYSNAIYIDLLESETFSRLLSHPERIEEIIPNNFKGYIVLDEVQKVPELLNEVHRLIENNKYTFILTGSSARKLRQKGVNLLAGRAYTKYMFPLTASELGSDFNLKKSIQFGHLPKACIDLDPKSFLSSYVETFLKEEVQQEGLVRNLGNFARFLEAASFSQGAVLNISNISRECSIHRKVVEDYFSILQDLLLSYEIPVFTKRAKRELVAHRKFYFFDVGIYQTLRPRGPLDSVTEINGAAVETLVLQELKAINAYKNLDYEIYYWRTKSGLEVDFILYGEKGFIAIEVKSSSTLMDSELKPLKLFLEDYPMAKAYFLYSGTKKLNRSQIEIIPLVEFLTHIERYLSV